MQRLGRGTIIRALEAVAGRLPANTPHSLVLMGGAALVLLYDAREATKDVDAFLIEGGSAEELRRVSRELAASLDLPEDWLNDGAKAYVHGLTLGERILSLPNLTVHALAPSQLLAMKLSAWRDDVDVEDARLLLSRLPGAREDVWRKVQAHIVPGRELKAQYAFADLWEAAHGTS